MIATSDQNRTNLAGPLEAASYSQADLIGDNTDLSSRTRRRQALVLNVDGSSLVCNVIVIQGADIQFIAMLEIRLAAALQHQVGRDCFTLVS